MMHGKKFGQMLCDALGLDAATTSRIVIESDPLKAAVVHVTHLVTNDQGQRLAEHLTTDYELLEIDGGENQ